MCLLVNSSVPYMCYMLTFRIMLIVLSTFAVAQLGIRLALIRILYSHNVGAKKVWMNQVSCSKTPVVTVEGVICFWKSASAGNLQKLALSVFRDPFVHPAAQ